MEKNLSEFQKRKPAAVLWHLITDAGESFDLLCRMNDHAKIYLENPRRIREWKQNLSPRDYSICMSALKAHLCVLICTMFDKGGRGGKEVISFRTTEWFTKNLKAKKIVDQICDEKIIKSMRDTRHTFIAHVAENVGPIVSIEGICESNLGKILERLKALYDVWYLGGM